MLKGVSYHISPAGPAPTTARVCCLPAATGKIFREVSCPALGFTRQDACLPEKVWSRQAWLQPMHVLISSDLPSAALIMKFGSAKKGRAMLTRSADPDAKISSAVSGALILMRRTRRWVMGVKRQGLGLG
jgi:hypothetical protein